MGIFNHVIRIIVLLLACVSIIACCAFDDGTYCGTSSCHCPNYIACFVWGRNQYCPPYCRSVQVPTTSGDDSACQSRNLALNRPAVQHPASWIEGSLDCSADLAVDGNPNPDLSLGSCAHPYDATGQSAVWWRVDLGQDYVIQTINITNRIGNEVRLKYTYIFVLQQGTSSNTQQLCYDLQDIGTAAYVWAECMAPLKGRYVRLQRHNNASEKNTMTVCEVQIYGYVYQDCMAGRWGNNCMNSCACRVSNEVCRDTDGHCSSGCDEGRIGTGCEIVLPGLDSPPTVRSAYASLLVTFDAWLPSNGGVAPDGYWVQYRLYSVSFWTTGTTVVHTEAQTYTATLSNLVPHSYYVRVLPYITYRGAMHEGLVSPESNLVIPQPITTTPPEASSSAEHSEVSISSERPEAFRSTEQTTLVTYRGLSAVSTDGIKGGLSGAALAGITIVTILLLVVIVAVVLFIKRNAILKNIRTARRPSENVLVHSEATDAERGVENPVMTEGTAMTNAVTGDGANTGVSEDGNEMSLGNDESVMKSTAPAIKPAVPAVNQEIPTVKPVVPAVNQEIPTVKPVVPAVNQEIPTVKPVVPAVNQEIPNVKPVVPAVNQEIPTVKPVVPAVNQEIPTVKPVVPAVNQEIPTVKHVVPAVNQEIPNVKSVVPAVNQEIPTVKPVVPAVNQEIPTGKPVVPAVNQDIPTVKPVVPAVNQEIPNVKPVVPKVKPLVAVGKPTAPAASTENETATTPSPPALSRCTIDSTKDLDSAGAVQEDVEDDDHVYGNQCPVGRPIRIEELAKYLEEMARIPNAYNMEFKRLPTGNTAKCEVGLHAGNRAKNRYANVCAYDHARVVLETSDGGEGATDYINASYIHGYREEARAFIATQGPTMKTRDDLWRMIWQTNSNRVVMVTRLAEDGKEKCSQYWDNHETLRLGNYSINVLKMEQFAEYTIRLMSLTNEEGKTRLVHHFHFTGWPDKGVPLVATSLLDFHRKVRAIDDEAQGPVIVHCSAGIGRTGTFMAIDTVLKQVQEDKVIDLFQYTGLMRNNRMDMIQTLDQYVFVYQAVLESLRCGNPIIPCNEMDKAYQGLLIISPDSGKTKLEEQFELLLSFKPVRRQEKFTGLDAQNKDKNRSLDIVPNNLVRPFLSTRTDSTTDYINAAYTDGYRSRRAYIVTQLPLPNTVCDIWRLMHDHHCNTLVLLHGIDLLDETTPIYWPATKGSVLTFEPLTITMLGEEGIEGAPTMREFQITHSKKVKSKPQTVRQYELLGWPESEDVPESPDAMLLLMEHVHSWQQRSGNRSIVVQCKYGTHHSGLFLAGSYMLEKLKVDQEVDVFHAVQQIRLARTQLVQSAEQYKFLHTLALSYMKNNETYANFR